MFEYGFDLNNNVSRLTTLTPYGNNKLNYTYGPDNQLTGMTLDNQKAVTYTYNGLGRLTNRSINLSAPLTNTYTYGTVTINDVTYQHNFISSETVGNVTYCYEYDANGNLTAIKDSNNTVLESYTYDDLNQLTSVEYPGTPNKRYEFTYDSSGNIKTEKIYVDDVLTTTNNYSYTDYTWYDLLKNYNGSIITYDDIGNPLSYRDGISFTWSNGRQLKSYTKNNSTVNYTYDSNGMRLSKDVNGVKRNYLYNNGLLVQEIVDNQRILDYSYDSAGNPVSVAYRTSLSATPIYYYYAVNSRGDVVGIYTASGSLLVVYEYDAWGNILSVKNANGVNIANPNSIANIQSLRYRGYCYDTDTGLYYLQRRYYDPMTHRFINADGYVSTGTGVLGYNMFSYCENNPVNSSDPTGEGRIYGPNFIGPIAPGDIRLGDLDFDNYFAGIKQKINPSRSNTSSGNTSTSSLSAFDYLVSALTSFSMNVGFGSGFYGGGKIAGVSVEGGARMTLLSLKIDASGIDIGNEGIYGCGIGPVKFLGGFFHSQNCERYRDIGQHSADTCPNATIYDPSVPNYNYDIVGFDIYCIIGLNFSIVWDETAFYEKVGYFE